MIVFLFVPFPLAIALSVLLQFMASEYTFASLNLSLFLFQKLPKMEVIEQNTDNKTVMSSF